MSGKTIGRLTLHAAHAAEHKRYYRSLITLLRIDKNDELSTAHRPHTTKQVPTAHNYNISTCTPSSSSLRCCLPSPLKGASDAGGWAKGDERWLGDAVTAQQLQLQQMGRLRAWCKILGASRISLGDVSRTGSVLEKRDTDPDGLMLMFMYSFPDVGVDPRLEPFKDIPEGEKDGSSGARVHKDVMDTARRRRRNIIQPRSDCRVGWVVQLP
eukprot:scaffold2866_cov148-Isochrysis_galbana.AAC.18